MNETTCPDCGRGSETLAHLLRIGERLAEELRAHGLSEHPRDAGGECEAGAAMHDWRRFTEGLRS